MSTSKTNNYFRVQGTLETFTFDESNAASVDVALVGARSLAYRNRTAHFRPAILVWRRFDHPDVRSLLTVGEQVIRAAN